MTCLKLSSVASNYFCIGFFMVLVICATLTGASKDINAPKSGITYLQVKMDNTSHSLHLGVSFNYTMSVEGCNLRSYLGCTLPSSTSQFYFPDASSLQ